MFLPQQFAHRNSACRLVYGVDALARLQAELAELGVRRPVLVSGRRTARSAVYRLAAAGLAGLEFAAYTEMPQHSPIARVRDLRDLALRHRADGFVALGGGSASDACKAAAAWLAEGGELESHAVRFTPPADLVMPRLDAPKLPIVAVPTTLSGAEVTMGASVRTEDGRKLGLVDSKLAARLVVIDPSASADVPADIFLSSGMNGLAHCIEGLYSRVQTPVTAALALHAIKLFMQALPAVAEAPGSVQGRGLALIAAHLSGLVLLNARSCLHHAACHALGAVAGISHGDANSIVLPHAMEFNRADPMAASVMADCAVALGAKEASAEAAIGQVRWLQAKLGVRRRLRDTGMPRSLLPAVAAKVMTERGLQVNPRTVSGPGQVEAMLVEAW